jgi:CO dehydrogenase/acetyl-CoA synthase delta subunit
MNARYEKTLDRIFANSVPADIKWRDIETMLVSLGATKFEGSGSRVRFELNGVRASFHRPHPNPETKRYAVRDVRDFLIAAGIKPE